jgi:hypothetical protein
MPPFPQASECHLLPTSGKFVAPSCPCAFLDTRILGTEASANPDYTNGSERSRVPGTRLAPGSTCAGKVGLLVRAEDLLTWRVFILLCSAARSSQLLPHADAGGLLAWRGLQGPGAKPPTPGTPGWEQRGKRKAREVSSPQH